MRFFIVAALALSSAACSLNEPSVGGPPPRLAELGYGYQTSRPLTNPLIFGHKSLGVACPAIDRDKVVRMNSAYIYKNDPSILQKEQTIVFPYMISKKKTPESASRELAFKAKKLARDFEIEITPVVEKIALEKGYLIVINEAFFEPQYKMCFGMLTSIDEEIISEITKSDFVRNEK